MTKEAKEKATKHADKSSTIQTSLQYSTQTQTMLGLSKFAVPHVPFAPSWYTCWIL
jgi:hypothetical protein